MSTFAESFLITKGAVFTADQMLSLPFAKIALPDNTVVFSINPVSRVKLGLIVSFVLTKAVIQLFVTVSFEFTFLASIVLISDFGSANSPSILSLYFSLAMVRSYSPRMSLGTISATINFVPCTQFS